MSDYQPIALDPGRIDPRPIESDVSVVIPTLGRPILEESLYWIASGTAWPQAILVVDQSASSAVAGLMERINELGISGRYIPSSQRGRSAGINRGLEHVETRFVAITDDDCFVEETWLERMAAHLRRHPGGIVTGRVEAAGEDMIVVVNSPEPAIYRRPRLAFDSMSGGNMATSMDVFDRVGYFDEHPSLATSEDGEWSYRALRHGAYIVYTPEAGVRHFGWRDEKGRERQYRGYARSHGGFYGKYLRKGDTFIAMRALLHFVRATRRWVRGALSGDQEMA
ncbi:MAG: glycosyltransferase, partial [Anaerolineales bacterium]|nr:glycosyltransferase [Anaerolineales bacterium]